MASTAYKMSLIIEFRFNFTIRYVVSMLTKSIQHYISRKEKFVHIEQAKPCKTGESKNEKKGEKACERT